MQPDFSCVLAGVAASRLINYTSGFLNRPIYFFALPILGKSNKMGLSQNV
jgi:hypothetical protein